MYVGEIQGEGGMCESPACIVGLQAVLIIFHYSCFMHDGAIGTVISVIGVGANQGMGTFEKKTPVILGCCMKLNLSL